jgi:hypothetical protein
VLIVTLAAVAWPAAAFDRNAEWEKGVAAFSAGDFESAWFRFFGLARAGDVESQFNIGQMYRLGRGIQRDVMEAKRWYERAAAMGYAPAQYQLGVLWERGDGVPPDLIEARGWFARAAQQNFDPAREALEAVEQILAGRGRPLRTPPANAQIDPATAARPNPPARAAQTSPAQTSPTQASPARAPVGAPSARAAPPPTQRTATNNANANTGTPIAPTLIVPKDPPASTPN